MDLEKKYSVRDVENIINTLIIQNYLVEMVVGKKESQYGGSYLELTPKGSEFKEGISSDLIIWNKVK